MTTERRDGSVTPWLVGGALLAALVAVLLAWVPLVTCTGCHGVMRLTATYPCDCCGGGLKVTILERWSWRRGALERALSGDDPDRY